MMYNTLKSVSDAGVFFPLEGCSLSCARFSSFCSHFSPQLQSMAARFHGSANRRCVSSPSGGLSSRRAYLSSAALFGFHGRSNIYYFISSDSSRTVLGSLAIGSCLRGVRGRGLGGGIITQARTPALKSPPPTAGACHRPPSHPFSPFLLWMCNTILSDTWCNPKIQNVNPHFFVFSFTGYLMKKKKHHKSSSSVLFSNM